ncbi:hypothetical protein S245_040431 [Arachis hypogaea]|uniref:Cytochrome P450 n=1 Tax=Arachis hypogaea TaxID=3818 RepID=A0A445AI81_ARAHY|nr:hypothetical protein Ahy_B02g060311 [Arachis hypogaea]
MAELIHSRKKLLKVREELEETFGKNREVEESHISKLPYLNVIVKETLRLHPPAPFLVPHKANDDVELGGFTVSKSARILINVWSIGRDSSSVWLTLSRLNLRDFCILKMIFKGKN